MPIQQWIPAIAVIVGGALAIAGVSQLWEAQRNSTSGGLKRLFIGAVLLLIGSVVAYASFPKAIGVG